MQYSWLNLLSLATYNHSYKLLLHFDLNYTSNTTPQHISVIMLFQKLISIVYTINHCLHTTPLQRKTKSFQNKFYEIKVSIDHTDHYAKKAFKILNKIFK